MNAGGIRADIKAGEVTWGELFTVQPFNNGLVKMDLTGQEIYDLLNQQFPAGRNTFRILQVSGLTYTWNDRLAPPGRITEVRRNGQPIDRAATYTVAVNSFLAEGGDKFGIFAEGKNRVTGPQDLKALCDYLQALPQPFNAKIDGKIEKRELKKSDGLFVGGGPGSSGSLPSPHTPLPTLLVWPKPGESPGFGPIILINLKGLGEGVWGRG